MIKLCLAACLWLAGGTHPKEDPYHLAWKALDGNQYAAAEQYLLQAAKDPRFRNDALTSLVFLQTYLGRETQIVTQYGDPMMRIADPEPYWYALWFSEACLGAYGKMDSLHQAHLRFVREHFRGSMQAAGAYFASYHELASHRPAQALEEEHRVHAIGRWAFTGPFDNIGGSGFNKDFGVIAHPDSGAVFTAFNNTSVTWFVPAVMQNASWVFPKPCFPATEGLVYAQSFVHSPADREVLLCLGGAGSLKVWVNDRLLFAEPRERVTEMDTYRVPCHLHAGYNRIVVQNGYADTEMPNFILRFGDAEGHAVDGLRGDPAYHAYTRDQGPLPEALPPFAETYFLKKIKGEPDNPVLYLLQARTYLRNQKTDETRALLEPLMTRHPRNTLLLATYLQCLSAEGNRTAWQAAMEKIKSLDPASIYNQLYREQQLEQDKKYTAALSVLDSIVGRTGLTAPLLESQIKLVAQTGNLDQLKTLIRQGVTQYPQYADFALYDYSYRKKVDHDPAAALHALEHYDSSAFNYNLIRALSNEYLEQGQNEKGRGVKQKLLADIPYVTDAYNDLAGYYFKAGQLDSAIAVLRRLLRNAPYRSETYRDIAICYEQLKDTARAREAYTRALQCDPSQAPYLNKIRELGRQPELEHYFPAFDAERRIADNLRRPYDSVHHYYYVFDVKNNLVLPQGASVEEVITAVHINDDKGIDAFKEMSIGYNSNFQELQIIEAEVRKKDGSKVPADQDGNQVVFTRLEAGDIVYWHYKRRSFGIGRLGREFWDNFYFSAAVPTQTCRYNLLLADGRTLHYRFLHDRHPAPSVSRHEQYTLYTWVRDSLPAIKDEPLSPQSADIGQVLHVSTIPSWATISRWYSDITRQQCGDNFDLDQAFAEIFPRGAGGLSADDKARDIYRYIVRHITYSSVPFRQSAYVPQKASKTLVTGMGDCKDMATLFVALARKAGLEANLVLVNTRDNGLQAMALPSMAFNHCIAAYGSGAARRYVELTDTDLPFGALPLDLRQAQSLFIPYGEGPGDSAVLAPLRSSRALADAVIRHLDIRVEGEDIAVQSRLQLTGALTSSYRYTYKNEPTDKTRDKLRERLDGIYKKSVDLGSVNLKGVDSLEDSLRVRVAYQVPNEIIHVNDLYMLKLNFIDVVANMNPFSVQDRHFPIDYAQYENTEHYATTVAVELPADARVSQLPEDVDLRFGDMHYTLRYRRAGDHALEVTRDFTTIPWKQIAPGDYTRFEDFFKRIIKAETQYIVYEQKTP